MAPPSPAPSAEAHGAPAKPGQARLVFITGASSGIGLALVARRTAAMQAWADAQGLSASRCRVFGADVADIDVMARTFALNNTGLAATFARRAFTAIAARASYRVIPWQMGVVAKLPRTLPNAWFDRLLAGRPRKHRQNPITTNGVD